MALDSGPNAEGFHPLPIPHVMLHGSASDARSQPLASISELAASQHNYLVRIKFARVHGGNSKSYFYLNQIKFVLFDPLTQTLYTAF